MWTPARAISHPELTLAWQLDSSKIPYEREYRFDPVRKWRLDFAFPQVKAGVEIEGGIWTQGAHSRPLGIIRDIEKGNALVLAGWRVLRFTPTAVKDGTALSAIEQLLGVV